MQTAYHTWDNRPRRPLRAPFPGAVTYGWRDCDIGVMDDWTINRRYGPVTDNVAPGREGGNGKSFSGLSGHMNRSVCGMSGFSNSSR